jgi:hypothetical protein
MTPDDFDYHPDQDLHIAIAKAGHDITVRRHRDAFFVFHFSLSFTWALTLALSYNVSIMCLLSYNVSARSEPK